MASLGKMLQLFTVLTDKILILSFIDMKSEPPTPVMLLLLKSFLFSTVLE